MNIQLFKLGTFNTVNDLIFLGINVCDFFRMSKFVNIYICEIFFTYYFLNLMNNTYCLF